MSFILVDTSIWIDFFRGRSVAEPLDELIKTNRISTNDLILAELIPSIRFRKEEKLQHLLLSIRRFDLSIDWQDITNMQLLNLRSGNNHVGIPDLIIAQNALHNDLVLFENDKHFQAMKKILGLDLFRQEEPSGS